MALTELAEKGGDADLLRDMIQFVAQRLPDCKSVRPKYDASADRRVIGQFGTQYDVVVPGSEILAAGCYLAFILVGHRTGAILSRSSGVQVSGYCRYESIATRPAAENYYAT